MKCSLDEVGYLPLAQTTNCSSCIPEQVTFTKSELDARFVGPTKNANGCLEMTAYCDPSSYGPKATTFMQVIDNPFVFNQFSICSSTFIWVVLKTLNKELSVLN